MKIKIFQKGFNYSQDGTGNRLVYHMQGCNMHCPWCANPEGIAIAGTLVVNPEMLIESVCPHGAIEKKQVDRKRCASCSTRECVYVNRNLGIRLSCDEIDVEAVFDEVLHSSALFFGGGGVTLTGGEPTLQYDAVRVLLDLLIEKHIHTAIETNGSHPKLAGLLPLVDLLIVDLKHYDDEVYRNSTGIGGRVIKENLLHAMATHGHVLIRIPVIKGFNDSDEDVRNFAAFFSGQEMRNTRFEFLPYHEFGKPKWEQCGIPYTMKDAFVDQQTITLFETTFTENRLSVIRT